MKNKLNQIVCPHCGDYESYVISLDDGTATCYWCYKRSKLTSEELKEARKK